MRNAWQLQEAKAKLSKVIDDSTRHGPQMVTRHGRPAAFVVSAAEFGQLAGRTEDFKTFLLRAPLYELNLARSRDRGRKIRL